MSPNECWSKIKEPRLPCLEQQIKKEIINNGFRIYSIFFGNPLLNHFHAIKYLDNDLVMHRYIIIA